MLVHLFQKVKLDHGAWGSFQSNGKRGRQHLDGGIHLLDALVADAQEVHVPLGIGGSAPFMGQVWFVPQLVVRNPPFVALGQNRKKVAEVREIRGRRFRGCAVPSRPWRRAVDANDELKVKLLGEGNNLVELLPCRLLPRLIEEFTFAALFDLFPRELLLDPLDAGVPGHLKGLLFLPDFNLFVKKCVGAPWVNPRLRNAALDVRLVFAAKRTACRNGERRRSRHQDVSASH